MYKAVREFTEDEATAEQMLDAVWNITSYPDFLRGVKRVEILQEDGQNILARFTAGVAGMEFNYVLKCERAEAEVRWRRVEGDFRDAEGCMRHLGENRFRYENAMDPGFAVPGFAVQFILERSLPRLIREFQQRARAAATEGRPSDA